MKRVFWRTAFFLSVFLVGMLLLIPATLVQRAIFPVFYDGSGLHGPDPLPMGVIVLGVCLCIADRSISRLFRLVGLTDERLERLSGTATNPMRYDNIGIARRIPGGQASRRVGYGLSECRS